MTDSISATYINADQINANRIYAASYSGAGGGGAIIVADKILLGKWLLEASNDGIYVTTPDGIKTKMELIDFRETPVPETAKLQKQSSQQSIPPIFVPQAS